MEADEESVASAQVPDIPRIGSVRKWVQRVRPQSLLQNTWFAVLMRNTTGSSVLALYCSASNSWFRLPLSTVKGPTLSTSNAGLLCFCSGREIRVVNPFKELEWSVALSAKTEVYTSAVLSSDNVVAIADMEYGNYPSRPHIVVYNHNRRSWREVHRFEPQEHLKYYACNLVVGDKVYFLAKDGQCGYKALLCYDWREELLVRKQLLMFGFGDDGGYPMVSPHLCYCNGKLIVVVTEVDCGLLMELYESEFEDDYKPITGLAVNEIDQETGKLRELFRMPMGMMQDLVESSDMYSHLRVTGRGKFVFLQFDHYVPWAGYAELVERERAVVCDVETGSWVLTPKKTMKYKQLLDVFPLDPARSLE